MLSSETFAELYGVLEIFINTGTYKARIRFAIIYLEMPDS